MTTVTGPVNDTLVSADDDMWTFTGILRAHNGGVVTSKPRLVKPIGGILIVDLPPGPVLITVGDTKVTALVPQEDCTLEELLAAAFAYPPDTPAELLAAAVGRYVLEHADTIAFDDVISSAGNTAAQFMRGGQPVGSALPLPAANWGNILGAPDDNSELADYIQGAVVTEVADVPAVSAAAASAAAANIGVLTAAKTPELLRNRAKNPQLKGGPAENVLSTTYDLAEVTGGLPAGFVYGGQTTRKGTLSTTVGQVRFGTAAGAHAQAIPVTPGETISVSFLVWCNSAAAGLTSRCRVVFWDASDVQVGSNYDSTNSALAVSAWELRKLENITVPATATHVTVQALTSGSGNAATGDVTKATGLMVVTGSTVPAYADGFSALWAWLGTAHASPSVQLWRSKTDQDAMLAEVGQAAAVKADLYTATLAGKNLYNPADPNVLNDTTINGVTNVTPTYVTSAGYRTTGWIPVTAGQQYTASAHRHIFFADASFVKVTGSGVNTGNNATVATYTAPAGAVWVRITFNYASYPTFQFEQGSSATAYEAYSPYLALTAKMKAAVAKQVFIDHPDPVSVQVSGSTLTVTSQLGGIDLSTQVSLNGSDNQAVRLVATTFGGQTISAHADDITPIRSVQMGTVGGNHGYVNGLGLYANPDGKTSVDVGSVWTDGTREYVLLAVTTEATPRLMMGGSYTGSAPVTVAQHTPSANLTHVSGATHTGAINYTTLAVADASSSLTQLRPSVGRITTSAWLDGRQLTADGTYGGKVFEVRESYEILDYKDIYDYAKTHVGMALDRNAIAGAVLVTNTYRWTGPGRCRIVTTYDELKPFQLDRCGAVQAIPLSLAGQTTTRYVPGMGTVGGFDWSAGVSYTSYAANNDLPASAEKVSGRISAFHLDTLSNGGTVLVGFAMGYLPYGSQPDTASRSAQRATKAATALWNMRDTKKCYPFFTTGEAAGWGHLQVDAYRQYLSPAQVASVVACKNDALAAFAALSAATGIAA